MTGLAHRSEIHVKAAVIDRLLAGPHVDSDAVLISEMTVANWTRRADVVLANGKLWAFEIKSDLDSLVRLPGQIETFRNYFEKFTIVAAERFEKAILDMAPEGVGVWIVGADGGVKQKVAPRQTLLTSDAYISLMTVTELRCLLAANGMRPARDAHRSMLEAAARGLPTSDLACAARDAVKRRHRARHVEFLRQQRSVGTLGAMHTLRRPQQARVVGPPAPAPLSATLQEYEIPSDHPLLVHAPGGPVLRRKLR